VKNGKNQNSREEENHQDGEGFSHPIPSRLSILCLLHGKL
jgi:hypothetical protein